MSWEWSIDGWIVLVGVLSACSCALLGNYLVLRRMSLMGDAISHAVLPGLAIAFLVTESRHALPMFVGAVIAGGLTAALSEAVRRYGNVEHGAAMGVVFSILFALGLILIRQAADHVDLDPGCVLYGNIAQVPLDAIGESIPPAARNLAIVLIVNILFVALFYKELRISTFDPDLATSLGYNAGALHYALMILVSVTTVANFEAVGSILVIAMLIVPAAAAYLLTDRLGAMIFFSLIIAATSAVSGHILATFGPSWLGITAPGGEGRVVSANTSAMMAVVAGVLLGGAVLLSPQHGIISRVYHTWLLRLQIIREDILGLLHRWQELQPVAGRTMTRQEILTAVGNTTLGRRSLRALARGRDVEIDEAGGVRLSPRGHSKAAGLIRSHRLWEAYLAKHFEIPLDHVHMGAERAEHFITPEMRSALSAEVTTQHDPHGKEIPPEE